MCASCAEMHKMPLEQQIEALRKCSEDAISFRRQSEENLISHENNSWRGGSQFR